MYLDVAALQQFYDKPAGQLARRMLRHHIKQTWPTLRRQRLLGIGYTMPYLRLYLEEAERVFAAMPAAQGVLPWPDERKNLVTLADIYNLPFEDYSLDRVMISHCLETAGDPLAFLNEVWRVLAGDGRLLLIVPNRLGLWARFEHTPFGTGQPYTATQLTRLLQQASFTTLSVQRTLYTPPTNSRFWLSSAKVFENMGSHLWAGLSGVLVIEARKDIYAALPARRVVKKPITIPGTTIPIGTPTNRT